MIIREATEAKFPSTYDGILTHPESNGLLNALLSECQRYRDNGCVGIPPQDFDWSTIDKNDMGDLMMIFTKKYLPDGTFEKYKCRIVFRGERWKNLHHLSTYSSSMDDDACKLLLATAATEDLDIFSADVKTAFLYETYPAGMRQWVRSPHGLPANFLPSY